MAFWDKITSRGHVEDRRSTGPMVLSGLGLASIATIFALNFLVGGDLSDALVLLEDIPIETLPQEQSPEFTGADEYEVFASTVLGSTNDLWSTQFSQLNQIYTPPRLVLFRELTQSACGVASSQVGPFYCPLDQTIYLDETFFEELTTRFGARGGDVAQAYVIAHEAAHHAQNQLGTMNQIAQTNEASIKLELQADCYAGLWAHSIRDLEVFMPEEIEEAMDAASAVGDDRIQEKVTGQVNPETWTHGSSEQRVTWFTTGFETGSLAACDTFNN